MTIRDQVRQFIIKNFYLPKPENLKDEVSFLDSGVIDSTGVLELVGFIEKQFGIVVDNGEMVPENLDSIANVVGFIERKKG
jgi:acyl carrier protein